MSTFAGDPAANGTVFIAITDTWANNDPFSLLLTLTSFSGICRSPPFSLSMANPHVYAGPALYQAGLRTTSPSANCV
jgi:hypothetical protein